MTSRSIQAALNRQFAKYMKIAATIVAVLFFVAGLRELIAPENGHVAALASSHFIAALSAVVMRVVLAKWEPVAWAHPLGFAATTLLLAKNLSTLYFFGDVSYSFHTALLIVGVGAIFLSIPWFIAMEALIVVAWMGVMALVVEGPVPLWEGPMPYEALAIGTTLFTVRLILHRNFERMRFRRRQERRELKEALESAEREMRERELAEAALRTQEERYRDFIEETDNLVTQTDPDGCLTFVNHTSERVYGLSPEACIGQSALDFIHPGDRERTQAALRSWLANHVQSATLENRQVDIDGETRTMLWTINLHYDEEGRVEALNSIGRDITDLRRAEEALRASEEQYRGIFEASTDGLLISDERGRVVEANPAMCQMLGYTYEEFVGIDPARFIHPDHLPAFQQFVETMRKGGKFHTIAKDIRKDGSEFPVEVNGVPIFYQGEPHMLGIVRDITERVESEEERQNFERQLQQSQKLESLGLLAGGIAHDFNNLLTGILGNASLAAAEIPTDSPARETLAQIEAASHRAAELCKQMLAYSGGGQFVVEPLNLSELVADLSNLLQSSISKKIALRCSFWETPLLIEADAIQIRQVVMNLIVNAAEAIGEEEGEIRLTTGVRACSQTYLDGARMNGGLDEGEYVFLDVEDSGCGMDAETLANIFDPFFSTKFTGRGLGLAAVLGIVRGHGGAILVDSKLGDGTCFTILFPPSSLPLKPVSEAEPPVQQRSGEGVVLIVDDEEAVLKVAHKALTRSGYRVLVAHDGLEGLEEFKRHVDEIDVVVLDLTMPRMDGEEALHEMAQIRPSVPVILSSGYMEQDVTARFSEHNLAGFLHKPYRAGQVVEMVADALARAQTHSH